MRSAAVIVAATATLATAGMAGTAFAASCPGQNQLRAASDCGDHGPAVRIANSSDEVVTYEVTGHGHHYQGQIDGSKDGGPKQTQIALGDAKPGDVWKVDYDHGARSESVKLAATCAPKHHGGQNSDDNSDDNSDEPSSPADENDDNPATPTTRPSAPTTPTVVATQVAAANQPALAKTGADNTMLIAGGAAVLLVAGAGTVLVTRRMRRNH